MNIEDHKITFINRNDEYHTTQITISSDAVLPDVIEAFELFLRGSGYIFKGTIGIVDEVKSIDLKNIADNFRVVPEEPRKLCRTCEYVLNNIRKEPCRSCFSDNFNNWQPKQ